MTAVPWICAQAGQRLTRKNSERAGPPPGLVRPGAPFCESPCLNP